MSETPLPPSPDDSDTGWGEPAEDTDDDVVRRLEDERPPHHDRD